MRWTPWPRETSAVLGGRRSRVVLTPQWLASSRRSDPPATVSKKPDRRGEHEGNRSTVAQGMPVAGFTCSDFARVLLSFAREAMGCGLRNPAFPAPSLLRGRCLASSGRLSRRGKVRAWLFEKSIHVVPDKRGEAERDPGPITTKAWVARSWGHRSL
jgi:hypothetical protein